MTDISPNSLLLILISTMIVLAIAILVMTIAVWVLIQQKKASQVQTADASGTAESPVANRPGTFSWQRIWARLWDIVPIEKEAKVDMGHNYDGIRELDNNLPPWWKYGFYLSIVFGVIYLWVYHINSDWSSEQDYAAEMAEAEAIKAQYLERVANQVNENSVTAVVDAEGLSTGKTIFGTYCMACHGAEGQGGIGPNLTDPYWVHGGDIQSVFKTVKYGVPLKGMQAWQDLLKPQEMQAVSSYILTLQGTNPPNPKAPEGTLLQPQSDSTATDSASLALQ